MECLFEINFTGEHIKNESRITVFPRVRACPCVLLMESRMDSAWAPSGPLLFLGVQRYRWQHADTWAPGHSDCAVFLCFTSGAAEIDLPQPQGGSKPACFSPGETIGDTWTMRLQRSLKMPSSKEWRSSELLFFFFMDSRDALLSAHVMIWPLIIYRDTLIVPYIWPFTVYICT